MARLAVDQLTVHYGKHCALDAVSFDVNPGEVFGIIGKNGAGKSTLIRAICGATLPRSGQILLGDKQLSRGEDRRDQIGFVPQTIALYPYLTARENLSVFGRLHGLSGSALRQAVDHGLSRVELSEHGDKLARNLSGGMARRINVAAAILHDPAILILDEPTAGTDIGARDAIHALITSLSKGGMSIMLITHELDAAAHLCDRVAVLQNGKLAALGAPQELLDNGFADNIIYRIKLAHFASETHGKELIKNGFITHDGQTYHRHFPAKSKALVAVQKRVAAFSEPPLEAAIIRPGLAELLDHYAQIDVRESAA